MTTTASTNARDFAWLLARFADETPGVEHALCVSADGLVMGASPRLSRATAERLAAVVSGIRSLADGAGRLLGQHDANQVIVELQSSFFFVVSVGDGSAMGVLASRVGTDMGQIGYEIALLVEQARSRLTPELASELKQLA
jgi:uncharacterized protein